jgi:hypothetical protein
MAINNFNVGVGTTSQLTRYRYVATGGETSVSGTDADGKTLSYTVGLEQVFLNGVNLVRGQDYTATNGTSVGSLTALVASDVVEVFAFVPFNIANALTVSTVDAKGDLLVGTGADTVGRLAVGTNNQLLAADSSTGSGLKWANPGMTLINTTSFTSVSSVSVPDNTFTATYNNYFALYVASFGTVASTTLRLRAAGSDLSSALYRYAHHYVATNADHALDTGNTQTSGRITSSNMNRHSVQINFFNPFLTAKTQFDVQAGGGRDATVFSFAQYGSNEYDATTSADAFTLIFSQTGTGVVSVYGFNK